MPREKTANKKAMKNPTYVSVSPDKKKKKKKMPKKDKKGGKLQCFYGKPKKDDEHGTRSFGGGVAARRLASHARETTPIKDERKKTANKKAMAQSTYKTLSPAQQSKVDSREAGRLRVDAIKRRHLEKYGTVFKDSRVKKSMPPKPNKPPPRAGRPTRAPPRRPSPEETVALPPPNRPAPMRPSPNRPPQTAPPPSRFRAGYLKGYALAGGVKANSFNSHAEALSAARNSGGRVGGITRLKRYGKTQWQTRTGTEIKDSPKGEMSYTL